MDDFTIGLAQYFQYLWFFVRPTLTLSTSSLKRGFRQQCKPGWCELLTREVYEVPDYWRQSFSGLPKTYTMRKKGCLITHGVRSWPRPKLAFSFILTVIFHLGDVRQTRQQRKVSQDSRSLKSDPEVSIKL